MSMAPQIKVEPDTLYPTVMPQHNGGLSRYSAAAYALAMSTAAHGEGKLEYVLLSVVYRVGFSCIPIK